MDMTARQMSMLNDLINGYEAMKETMLDICNSDEYKKAAELMGSVSDELGTYEYCPPVVTLFLPLCVALGEIKLAAKLLNFDFDDDMTKAMNANVKICNEMLPQLDKYRGHLEAAIELTKTDFNPN